jgi:ribonuclease BN (tRNA processing enzyme)
MKIIPLGISGFIPTLERETLSILIIINNCAIIFDCGTGLKRLLLNEIKVQLNNIDSVHVFLTHFHMDHLAGFPWLLKLIDKPINFYVPSYPLIDSDGIENVKIITNNPFFGLDIKSWPNFKSLTKVIENITIENNINIKIKKQTHSGGSVGYRLNNFAYITDVEVQDDHKEFINNCDLALIDTMYDAEDYNKLKSPTIPLDHGSSIGNANIALNSSIDKLGLIHLNPLYSSQRIIKLLSETRNVFENSFIPKEGMIYEL